MKTWLCLFFIAVICRASAGDIEKVSLPLIPDLRRADLYVLKLTDQPVGVLVLCPGCNGNGKDWIENASWQDFARAHSLDLAGLSFASDVDLLEGGKGYYYASQGSGKLLLDGLRQVYGRDLRLIMYGFSGGAHFTSRFVDWKPDRIITWCAYSAGWWDEPTSRSVSPPGLVACGEKDERLGPSLMYFKQGRSLGKPWLWLCAPVTGHSIYPPAEDFIRNYFAATLDKDEASAAGAWVDIDLKEEVAKDFVNSQPSLTGWLPDSKILSKWKEIHQP